VPEAPTAVVFDLGGVLIDWNPRHLYRKLFGPDEAAMEAFLGRICSPAWNHRMDEGRPFGEAIAELVVAHPEHEAMIGAYFDRWLEMIGGPIEDTVVLLKALHEARRPLWAITNWSAETFPLVREAPEYQFLDLFQEIFVSGALRMAKPRPEIFHHAIAAMKVAPESCLYIDDSPANVAAAASVGMQAHHFTGAPELERVLREGGLLTPA
jgi:2-haloacid dehalogenase